MPGVPAVDDDRRQLLQVIQSQTLRHRKLPVVSVGRVLKHRRVTLYGSSDCSACATVCQRLDRAGWKYRKVNVDVHSVEDKGQRTLRRRYPKWAGYIPVIYVDGVWGELGESGRWEVFAPW